MKQALRTTGLIIVLLMITVSYVNAQTPPPIPSDDQINDIASELYCPVCENVPLDVCGTQACEQWRGVIRDKLTQGWSKKEIKQYFVDQYGDRVLATPPARGFNWLIYIVPPAIILAGVYMFSRAFSVWKQPIQSIDSIPNNNQDEYIARLEEELNKR